jgi:hypothetical protein
MFLDVLKVAGAMWEAIDVVDIDGLDDEVDSCMRGGRTDWHCAVSILPALRVSS